MRNLAYFLFLFFFLVLNQFTSAEGSPGCEKPEPSGPPMPGGVSAVAKLEDNEKNKFIDKMQKRHTDIDFSNWSLCKYGPTATTDGHFYYEYKFKAVCNKICLLNGLRYRKGSILQIEGSRNSIDDSKEIDFFQTKLLNR